MRKRELKNVEWTILIVAVILCVIGLVALFSATQETEHADFNKQCIWFVVSLVIMVGAMLVDYEILIKISPVIYGMFIILLIGVLFTPEINGATSWFDIGFFSFQPGEFAKIFVILFLALAINKIQERGKQEINRPTRLLALIAILGVPVLLIIKQPDFGTAAAYIVAAALMIIAAGIDKRYIMSENDLESRDYDIRRKWLEHLTNQYDIPEPISANFMVASEQFYNNPNNTTMTLDFGRTNMNIAPFMTRFLYNLGYKVNFDDVLKGGQICAEKISLAMSKVQKSKTGVQMGKESIGIYNEPCFSSDVLKRIKEYAETIKGVEKYFRKTVGMPEIKNYDEQGVEIDE